MTLKRLWSVLAWVWRASRYDEKEDDAMNEPQASDEWPASCLALGCVLRIERRQDALLVSHDPRLEPDWAVELVMQGESPDGVMVALNDWSDLVHGDPPDPAAPHEHVMRPWRSLAHFHPRTQTVLGCGRCGQLACAACSWADQIPPERLQKIPRRHRRRADGRGQGQMRP